MAEILRALRAAVRFLKNQDWPAVWPNLIATVIGGLILMMLQGCFG
ncbi:MAG: hypothetical protein H7124_01590 [Phycisphaerales bacterium]|nr:hypothetical protein [Hyphomonadaceae bacterium]